MDMRPEIISGRFLAIPTPRPKHGGLAASKASRQFMSQLTEGGMSVQDQAVLGQLMKLMANDSMLYRIQVQPRRTPEEAGLMAWQNLYFDKEDGKRIEENRLKRNAQWMEDSQLQIVEGWGAPLPPEPLLIDQYVPGSAEELLDMPAFTLPNHGPTSRVHAKFLRLFTDRMKDAGYVIDGTRADTVAFTPPRWMHDADTIILGDSQLGSGGYNGYLNRATVQICCPGMRATEGIRMLDDVRECFPYVDTVIITAGTNDWLKRKEVTHAMSEYESTRVGNQVCNQVIDVLQKIIPKAGLRYVFATPPRVGADGGGKYLRKFIRQLQHLLRATFPNGRTPHGILVVNVTSEYGWNAIDASDHIPVSQISDYISKVELEMQRLDEEAPELVKDVNACANLFLLSHASITVRVEGLEANQERKTRLRAMDEEWDRLAPALHTAPWGAALDEIVPHENASMLRINQSAKDASRAFLNLVNASDSDFLPGRMKIREHDPTAAARYAPRFTEFFKFVLKVHASCETELEFEKFMSTKLRNMGKIKQRGRRIVSFNDGEVADFLDGLEGWGIEMQLSQGTYRRTVDQIRDLTINDFFGVAAAVGLPRLEEGPEAVAAKYRGGPNQGYQIPDGVRALFASHLSQMALAFFFPPIKGTPQVATLISSHRAWTLKGLANLRKILARPLVQADLCFILGIPPGRLEDCLTVHTKVGLLGPAPQEPFRLPRLLIEKLPWILHPYSYFNRQTLQAPRYFNVPVRTTTVRFLDNGLNARLSFYNLTRHASKTMARIFKKGHLFFRREALEAMTRLLAERQQIAIPESGHFDPDQYPELARKDLWLMKQDKEELIKSPLAMEIFAFEQRNRDMAAANIVRVILNPTPATQTTQLSEGRVIRNDHAWCCKAPPTVGDDPIHGGGGPAEIKQGIERERQGTG